MKISASKSKRLVYGKIKVMVEDRDEQSVMEMEEVESGDIQVFRNCFIT